MTKKRLLLIATLPLAIAVTLGVLAMLPSRGVTKENYYRIQEGMTLKDVEGVFGRPSVSFDFLNHEGEVGAICWRNWKADDGTIAAIAFHQDLVVDKVWSDPTETLRDKIRRWLHLD
jgi:hypothetical protein